MTSKDSDSLCSECGKEIQTDWVTCPYCSESIGPPPYQSLELHDSVIGGDVTITQNVSDISTCELCHSVNSEITICTNCSKTAHCSSCLTTSRSDFIEWINDSNDLDTSIRNAIFRKTYAREFLCNKCSIKSFEQALPLVLEDTEKCDFCSTPYSSYLWWGRTDIRMIEEWCRGNHDSLKRYELPADVGHVCGVDKVLWSILQLNHHLSHNYSNAKRPCVEITNVVNMDLLPIYVHPNSHTWMDYEEYLRRHYPSEARQRLRYTTGTSSTKKCKEQGNLTTYEDDNLLIASEKVLEMLGHSKNNPLSFDDVSFKIIFCNNS